MDRACEHDRLVAQLRPVVVAPGNQRRLHLRPLQDEARLWFVDGERDRLVEQRLVFDHAAGLEPALADRITFGLASSMRIASSFAANPPNTTECIAPMRAQASIAITASGTIGM